MKSLFVFLVICMAASCEPEPKAPPLTETEMRDKLLEMNKDMLAMEDQRIEEFVREKGWAVIKTGTGLRYFIYEDQEGPLAQPGQTAEVSFEVSLMDGTVCYASKEGETRNFKVEGSDVESGLHEAIQHMGEGDRAKVIIPSYLAHGLAGDLNKIPVKSTIIYDIHLHSLR